MITIYTDGSANNRAEVKNGGLGVVLLFTDDGGTTHIKKHSEGQFINTTSARMEILAVIRALQLITITKQHKIIINCDNQYVVNTEMKGWLETWITHKRDQANMDLWHVFRDEFYRHGGLAYVELRWVKGHNGNHYNEIADQLAGEGRKILTTKNDFDAHIQTK